MSARNPSLQNVPVHPRAQWRELLRDALCTLVLALIVFGPITGLQLKGLDFIANWQRPILLAVCVTLGRLLFLSALNTDCLRRRLQCSAIQKPPVNHRANRA